MKFLFSLIVAAAYFSCSTFAQGESSSCTRVGKPFILYSCTDGNRVGSACELGCRAGFRLIGEKFTMCTAGGFFPSIEENACVRENRTCERVEISRMQYRCSDAHRIGSVCRLRCLSGFRLHGVTRVECFEGGYEPSPENNECVDNRIPLVAPVSTTPCSRPADHRLTYSCTNENEVGSTCGINCLRGFQLKGERTTTCTKNGFNPPIADTHCIRETRVCERIEIPLMSYECSDANRRGSVCRLRCDSGYRLHGVTRTECKKSGFDPSPKNNECK